MNRDDARVLLRAVLIALAIVLAAAAVVHAEEPKLPAGISLEAVP